MKLRNMIGEKKQFKGNAVVNSNGVADILYSQFLLSSPFYC